MVDHILLKAARLSPGLPMPLSALESFEHLGRQQLHEKIATMQIPAVPQGNNQIIATPLAAKSITQQNDFILNIDQAFLEHYPSISISNCDRFSILGTESLLAPSSQNKFFIEVRDCSNFSISNINCVHLRSMLLISESTTFTIKNCGCSDAEGSGITIFNGNNFRISKCIFRNNLSAGILIVGNTFNGEIRDCACSHSRGYYNQDAGIHLCCTSPHITSAHIPESYHEALPITSKGQRPHHILIKNCMATHCRAQGIYLEGAVNCLIEDTILLNNNKEGICFDWGSCYNIFHRNIVALNGERKELSPDEIQADFISDYPLLEDKSSSMKLPGISIDNGCMNLIAENTITANHGGGIKMIRTALFNTIIHNQILGNAIGANTFVPCFHGITMLGIGAINNEFDTNRPAFLDFTPSILNTISGNTIKDHWLPIFHDKLSDNNFISDNIITKQRRPPTRMATNWLRTKAFLKRQYMKLFQQINA